jgi:hypothetical protein
MVKTIIGCDKAVAISRINDNIGVLQKARHEAKYSSLSMEAIQETIAHCNKHIAEYKSILKSITS